jgi:hypothetical protein
MCELFILITHLLVTLAKLARPGGLCAVTAESLAVKQQLLIMKRARRRAPKLTPWDRLAANPGALKRVTVRPEVSEVATLVGRLLDVEKREADLYGIDAPKKAQALSAVTGQTLSDEEADVGLARLTSEEQETFMMLLQKFQGRWVEPPAIDDQGVTVETTATTVQPNGAVE